MILDISFYILFIFLSIIQMMPRYKHYIQLRTKQQKEIKITNEELQYMSLEISSWDFCLCLFIVCIFSFEGLYYITNKYSNNIIIQTGIIIPFWLFLSGNIARIIYYYIGSNKKWKHYKLINEEQKQIFWIIVPIMINFIYLFNNIKLALMITAILIGKFVWLDFSINNEIKECINQFILRNNKTILIAFKFTIYIISGTILCLIVKYIR